MRMFLQFSCLDGINATIVFGSPFFMRRDIFYFMVKKDIFLEDIEYSDKDLTKEAEADDFAEKWTFPKEQESEMMKIFHITESDVVEFAKKSQYTSGFNHWEASKEWTSALYSWAQIHCSGRFRLTGLKEHAF
eukprot:TRINITY_DN27768_c0_g1_i1.p2 TRINITY_DN27768_c0_g1~~TRINITY_DN27768_c0_g1_i1.p2  ORF type:complete len:133 (+),score=0.72 TRINITY_DN27768_c0_g1_i1:242-640(+)